MNQFINPSHPRTLGAAVILSYFQGVFSLLAGGGSVLGAAGLLVGLGLLGGAFLTANDRKVGHVLILVCSGLGAALAAYRLIDALIVAPGLLSALAFLNLILSILIDSVFPVALFAAAVHPQSRNWVKAYFE